MEAELAQRAEHYQTQDPLQAASASLNELLESRLNDASDIRETFQFDRAGANHFGVDIISWYQAHTRDSRGTNDQLVAAAQVSLQPVVLDLLPIVGREMQTTLRLLYPVVGSLATKQGLTDSRPTIEFLQHPEMPGLMKERIFEEWSWHATLPEASQPDSPAAETDAPVDPELEFKLRAKKWLDDFIGTWDGTAVHIDPRILSPVAAHIDDLETKYSFVLAHVLYQPQSDEYPPAFKIRNAHDASLISWLDQKFRGRNLNINLITAQPNRQKTPLQETFDTRLDQLFEDYSQLQRQRERK